jgi:hypothetical protein
VTGSIPTRDARLDPLPVRKLLSLGEIWTGIEHVRDFVVAEAKRLDTPFSLDRILNAEGPPGGLDLGMCRDGLEAVGQLAGAVADDVRRQGKYGAAQGFIGTAQERMVAIANAIESFRQSQGTLKSGQEMKTGDAPLPLDLRNERANKDHTAFWRDQQSGRSDGDRTVERNTQKLRDQAQRNSAFHTAGACTGGGSIARKHLTGDFSKSMSNQDRNAWYSKFWAEKGGR